MLRDELKPEILDLIEARDWPTLRETVADWPPPEVADLLLHLRKADRVLLYRALPRPLATTVFAYLDPDQEEALLADLTDEETRHLLETLSPDDRTHLLAELPGQVTQRLLNLLSGGDLREARFLLGYPEESVGRLMTPDYVAIRADWTVETALRHLRAHGRDSETINRLYVIDADWRLLDDVELRRLILADPEAAVESIMDHAFVSISAFADREEAVRLFQRYGQVAIPVLDSGGVLVGIVTVDDVLDVAQQEATEDFHKVGSVGPIRASLREVGVGFLYRRRIGWLLALVVMNIFSGEVMRAFEETIAATVALVFFLPPLIASAGNAGAQAATLMVRAMATGDVLMRDWLRLLGKELGVATALAVTMAGAIYIVGVYRGGTGLALVVGLTMLAVVVVGSLIGMSLPFLLTRFRLDPATASAPLVTSIADITGVVVYFTIATWHLGSG
jgi:magnesium transporter